MIIRIRCKDGNFRFDLPPTARFSELVAEIEKKIDPNVDPATLTFSNEGPKGGETYSKHRNRSLQSVGLSHGDLLFVNYQLKQGQAEAPSTSAPTAPPSAWEQVVEDPVDTYWRKQDGKIPRARDAKFCTHGANAMCDYCMPLEPYDAQYHKDKGIKYLSYHAYLHKLSPAASSTAPTSSSSTLPPLEALSYRVKTPCPNGKHAPWPGGICTACQPSTITLQPQSFRMVDHLELSSNEVVDRFLQAWRKTGTQRFGWLLGRYEPYDKVPMGIKAVVEAIHEPPQEGELDGLTLGLPWEDEKNIRELAAAASTPLSIVGCIFTDLDPSEEDRTKNVYKRHAQSFFLSSLEVIFSASLQLQNPTVSRSSVTGKFSSRFVTAVASATEDGGVDISAYQMSEQACAMVDADLIEASVDPGIVRIKDESRTEKDARYVPDVFYRYKNEYGFDVRKSAKPCFPVEYLIVNVTHGFPQVPTPVFVSNKFAIENRPGLENQDIQNVLKELSKLRAPDVTNSPDAVRHEPENFRKIVEYLSDWHLVAFLRTTQLFSEVDVKLLVRVASSRGQEPKLFEELFATESWQTLMTFTRESAPPQRTLQEPSASTSVTEYDDLPQDNKDQIARMEAEGASTDHPMEEVVQAGPASNVRICPHCTFENSHGGSDCEVCGLPLG